MRLYNLSSCTPMAASGSKGAKWSSPKTYLPNCGDKDPNSIFHPQLQQKRPSFKTRQARIPEQNGSLPENPPKVENTRRLSKRISLFPSTRFLFDIDDDEKTEIMEAQSERHEAQNSLPSLSTLSTSTTLRDTCHSSERKCGIRMPFPTSAVVLNQSPQQSSRAHSFICPNLALTESSGSSSSWLDFSSDSFDENLFEIQGQKEVEKPTGLSTEPICKADLASRRPLRDIILPKISKGKGPNSNLNNNRLHCSNFPPYSIVQEKSMKVSESFAIQRIGQGKQHRHPTTMRPHTRQPCHLLREERSNEHFSKYSSMLKSGFSIESVKTEMHQDFVDPSLIQLVTLVSNACR